MAWAHKGRSYISAQLWKDHAPFDGLDEIDTILVTVFTRKLKLFLNRYPLNVLVISSRPYTNFMPLSRFTVLQLKPLTKEQALLA